MKSICIKTNDIHLLNYLLNEFDYIEIDKVCVSTNQFKNYKNIIIHYTGNDVSAFIHEISCILSCFVIDEIEESIISEYKEKFSNYINDDMNMPGAMSVVWEIARNTKKSKSFAELLLEFDKVLGLDIKNAEQYLKEFKQENEELPDDIKDLITERNKARENKNWQKSDELRDKIISMGYSIKDTKDGIIVKKEK